MGVRRGGHRESSGAFIWAKRKLLFWTVLFLVDSLFLSGPGSRSAVPWLQW